MVRLLFLVGTTGLERRDLLIELTWAHMIKETRPRWGKDSLNKGSSAVHIDG
jgi:hypothetical protein